MLRVTISNGSKRLYVGKSTKPNKCSSIYAAVKRVVCSALNSFVANTHEGCARCFFFVLSSANTWFYRK